MAMTKLEMVRQSIEQLGEVSAEDLASFIEIKHGVCIEPRFIPVVRASLRELDLLAKLRAESKLLVERTRQQAASGQGVAA